MVVKIDSKFIDALSRNKFIFISVVISMFFLAIFSVYIVNYISNKEFKNNVSLNINNNIDSDSKSNLNENSNPNFQDIIKICNIFEEEFKDIKKEINSLKYPVIIAYPDTEAKNRNIRIEKLEERLSEQQKLLLTCVR